MNRYKDDVAWKSCSLEDLWAFDKLILSRKLGYVCGPAGVDVPKSDYYIIRPITNIMGMGIKAEIAYMTNPTDNLRPGSFWCEVFEGRHLSVDYTDTTQVLCVEGFKSHPSLTEWKKWRKVEDKIAYPDVLRELKGDNPYINCEFIDGKLIEFHLRHNPDFEDGDNELYPIWEGEEIIVPNGMEFIESREHTRKGFLRWKR